MDQVDHMEKITDVKDNGMMENTMSTVIEKNNIQFGMAKAMITKHKT